MDKELNRYLAAAIADGADGLVSTEEAAEAMREAGVVAWDTEPRQLEAMGREIALLRADRDDFYRWRDKWVTDMDATVAKLAYAEDRAERAEATIARVEAALDVRTQVRAWMTHLGYEDHEIDIAEAWRQPPEPWLQDDPPQYVIELDTACGVARQYEETIRAALEG